jgi:hypothetical protein
MCKRKMTLFHVTTERKAKLYSETGRIIAPVRGFTNITAALAWACKVGRTVILQIEGLDCHKLPDHHNIFGDAYWVDHDIEQWQCVFSEKDA